MLKELLVDGIERGLHGENKKVTLTTNPYQKDATKIGKTIQSGRKSYTVVAGQEGSGKTAFVDTMYLLNPFLYARYHDTTYPFTIYRSMERGLVEKAAKFLAFFIFAESRGKYEYDVDTILSTLTAAKDLESKDLQIFEQHYHLLDELEAHMAFVPGVSTPEEVINYASNVAMQLGSVIESVDGAVLVNKKVIGHFNDNDFEVRDGIKMRYFQFKTFRFYEGTQRYVPSDPNRIVTHITDHIGKFGDDKKIIDVHSNNMASICRDLYEWQVIDISQINRMGANNERGVVNIYEFKNSKAVTENADVAIAIVCPASDRLMTWAEYDIPSTIEKGEFLLRGLVNIKGSRSRVKPMMGFEFRGACGAMFELPPASEMSEIDYYNLKLKNRKLY